MEESSSFSIQSPLYFWVTEQSMKLLYLFITTTKTRGDSNPSHMQQESSTKATGLYCHPESIILFTDDSTVVGVVAKRNCKYQFVMDMLSNLLSFPHKSNFLSFSFKNQYIVHISLKPYFAHSACEKCHQIHWTLISRVTKKGVFLYVMSHSFAKSQWMKI